MFTKRLVRIISLIGLLVPLLAAHRLAAVYAADPEPLAPVAARPQQGGSFRVYLPLIVQPGSPTAQPTTTGVAPTMTSTPPGATATATTTGMTPTTTTTATSEAPTTTPTSTTAIAVPPTATTTTTAVPGGPSGALLFGKDDSYRSADVAVDAQGGMHVAFSKIAPSIDNTHKPVFYGYCPPTNLATCARLDGWTLTPVLDTGADDWPWVQLELTPGGKPRLLIMRNMWFEGRFSAGKQWVYAACDTTCGNTKSWDTIEVLHTETSDDYNDLEYSYHTFALDHLGRPRFIFEDRTDQNGAFYGSYYAACDANCTQSGTWSATRIDRDVKDGNVGIDDQAVLRLTADGHPRVFAYGGYSSNHMTYVECNANCNDSANWSMPALVFNLSSGPGHRSWSPAIDSQGRPRIALYPIAGTLRYLWCDQGCTDVARWTEVKLPLKSDSGEYPSLALDTQGRPRISYQHESGLGYAYCNSRCESAEGEWIFGEAEDSNRLNAEFPIKPLPGCTEGSWIGGYRTSLALDGQGNPRIAYDAEYLMRCQSESGSTNVESKWWTSRLIFFPKP